ncbi:MAG: P1 family peptidase, partial [Chitinophagaceae bacterium]
TLNVGRAVEAVVDYTLQQPGNEKVQSVNAIVGETNDGELNDMFYGMSKRQVGNAPYQVMATPSLRKPKPISSTQTQLSKWFPMPNFRNTNRRTSIITTRIQPDRNGEER